MKQLWGISFPWWHFVVRGAVVYGAVLMLLRLSGKRQVGQMGTGEFVAILLISNAVQNSMNGGDNSITGGLMLAAVIIALTLFIDYLSFKSPVFESLIEGRPTLLMHQGKLLKNNLESERVNIRDFKSMLRRQGVASMDEVAEAVLESNGSVSVVKKSEVRSKDSTDISSS